MVRYITINKLHTREILLLLMAEDVASSVTSSTLSLRSSRWLLSMLILRLLIILGVPWYCCAEGRPWTTLTSVRSKSGHLYRSRSGPHWWRCEWKRGCPEDVGLASK